MMCQLAATNSCRVYIGLLGAPLFVTHIVILHRVWLLIDRYSGLLQLEGSRCAAAILRGIFKASRRA